MRARARLVRLLALLPLLVLPACGPGPGEQAAVTAIVSPTPTSQTARPSTPAPPGPAPSGTHPTGEPTSTPPAAEPHPPSATSPSASPRLTGRPTQTPSPSPRPSNDPGPPEPPRLAGAWGAAWQEGGSVATVGSLTSGAAWSTVKVPLSAAALRAHGDADLALVERAITASDNDAAMSLWAGLGEVGQAGASVDAVLRSWGDGRTVTQTSQVLPPYSPYGQTTWTLQDQVTAVTGLACDGTTADAQVLAAMGRVVPDQRWGLGRLPASFKGGWGPGANGMYLVRQLGVVTVEGQRYAVAVAARADDGTFASGVVMLDELTTWLEDSLPAEASPLHCG